MRRDKSRDAKRKKRDQRRIAAALTPQERARQRFEAKLEVVKAKAAYDEALANQERVLAETQPLVDGLKEALLEQFAGQPEILADFGLIPRSEVPVKQGDRARPETDAEGTTRLRQESSAAPRRRGR